MATYTLAPARGGRDTRQGHRVPALPPGRVPHAGTRPARAQGDENRGEMSLFPACASHRVFSGRLMSPEHHQDDARGHPLPCLNPFACAECERDPAAPSPRSVPPSPSSLLDSHNLGAVGKTDSWNQPAPAVRAAMPTPLPWRWAPNWRPPGEAKMPPKKSDAVAPKNHWPEAGSPQPLPDPGAAHGTASKPPRAAGGCNKAGKTPIKK